jgi:Ca-activated chloride channel homolog
MQFENQAVLFGLFALPLLILFYVWVKSRRKKLLTRLGGWDLVIRLIGSVSNTKRFIKAGLIIFSVALLIFTLSRPQYGSIERPVTRKGVDIFIAIDTSLSMMATDIKPNRLSRAKEQLNGLIHRLKGDRVGIITFAGTAFVQCPLTMDYGLARNILSSINHDSVPVDGTAIGTTIRTAIKAFERSSEGEKVLVLLTDGEDHNTSPEDAAKEAAQAGIKIYSIGIGSVKGEPILLPDGSFKRDSKGHTVNSRLDLDLLQKIALTTNGKAIMANQKGGLELDRIYEDIGLLQKGTLRSKTYTIFEERFQYFLLPVILLLILEMLISDRKKRVHGIAMLLLILPFIFGFKLKDDLSDFTRKGNSEFSQQNYDKALEYYKNAQVESPESPELHFNIANVLLKENKHEEAIREYEQAAALFKDTGNMSNAYYNIGVAQYRMGEQLANMENYQEAIKKLEEAMSSNQQAMRRNPEDRDPKFNYEQAKRLWKQILDKLKDQQKENKEENKEQNQEQEKDKNKKEKKDGEKEENEEKKEGEGKEESEENQKDQKQQKEEEKKGEEKKETEKKAEEQKENEEQQQKQVKIGEMSKEDALRLLSTLPQENKEALKEALKMKHKNVTGTSKDW